MMSKSNSATEKLLESFGHSDFHRPQREVIENLIAQRNTLCLMPTGSGKSLCYQIAGLQMGGTTVVLFPLRALASQQAQILTTQYDLDVVAIDAGMSGQQQYTQIRQLLAKPPHFIFFSVERASQDGYLEFVLRKLADRITLVAIDESHCVSQWGENFRPAYKEIPDFLDRVFFNTSRPPVLCLTATLNPKDADDICKDFRIETDSVFRSESLFRTNLELRRELLADEKAKHIRLEQILKSHPNEKVLVYVHRKKGEHGTCRLGEVFRKNGFECDYFDADLETDERTRVLDDFKSGKTRIVFATGAFGMGIHIPDIRVVIHYLMPESIESYYQEAGRAGRDGKPAICYLLFTETNIRVRKDLINASFPSGKALVNFYQKILQFDPGDTTELEPISTLQGDNLLCFYLLKSNGVFDVVTRGLRSIHDFTLIDPVSRFKEYGAASKLGLIRIISKKTSVPLQELMRDLYSWYSDGKLKLARAPGKMLFLQKKQDLTDDLVAKIETEILAKKKHRQLGLEKFIELIRSADVPEIGIRAHLGLPKSN